MSVKGLDFFWHQDIFQNVRLMQLMFWVLLLWLHDFFTLLFVLWLQDVEPTDLKHTVKASGSASDIFSNILFINYSLWWDRLSCMPGWLELSMYLKMTLSLLLLLLQRPNAGIAGVWYHMQFHVVLGTELKALPMLGKHSTNWAMISAPEILRI